MWHFSRTGSDNAFYYIALKPNGFELGKVDQRLKDSTGDYLLQGGQRFLWTNSTPYPIGVWYTLRVKQVGAVIQVWVDGMPVCNFSDGPNSGGTPVWNSAESVLTQGAWGYYHEDARVQFDDGPLVATGASPCPSDTPTNLRTTPTVSTLPLSWAAPANPSGTVQGYNVYKNGVKDNGALEAATGYTLTGLANNTTYTVSVKTVVGGSESGGATIYATTTAGSGGVISVSTAAQLTTALANAAPGQTIQLADGTYNGQFILRNKTATTSQPIIIQGSPNAIINGGSTGSGYAFYIDTCSYIQLIGFQITGAQKSIVMDQSQHCTIDSLTCHDCGAESILVRNLSCDNLITNCEVYNTGLVSPQYGEGIYIGMYYGDWSAAKSRTGGAPDASDRNTISYNNIHNTGAECIDIKEGTSNGIIDHNTLEGANMSGLNYADSWIDIAGCGYQVTYNSGTNALLDGIQTHTQPGGVQTASNNIFRNNILGVNAGGYGIAIDTAGTGNVVYSSNTATGATKGLTNITVTNG